MTLFKSVLVPFFPSDQGKSKILMLENARTIVDRFGCSLILLPAKMDQLAEVLNAIEFYSPDLLLVPFEPGGDGERFLLDHNIQELLERSALPTIIVPRKQSLKRYKASFILVPMTAERQKNEALELALKMAGELQIPLDLMHITPEGGPCSCRAARLEQPGDEFHHEYPYLVEDLVAQACPFSTRRERQLIRGFLHCRGNPEEEIQSRMCVEGGGILVLLWSGSLRQGRAVTLKATLKSANYPVILVKRRPEASFQLKVGKNFAA